MFLTGHPVSATTTRDGEIVAQTWLTLFYFMGGLSTAKQKEIKKIIKLNQCAVCNNV